MFERRYAWVQKNYKAVEKKPTCLNKLIGEVKWFIKSLLRKMKKAAAETGINTIALAGGVSANSGLRNAFLAMQEKEGWNVFIPPFEYCTDNAAMIAIAGYYKFLKGDFTTQGVAPLARMNL